MTELERSLLDGLKNMEALLAQEQIAQAEKLKSLEKRLSDLEELSPELARLCNDLERSLARLSAAGITAYPK